MSGIEKGINAFFAGLIAVAVFAVLAKQGSRGPELLSAGGTGIGNALYAAEGVGQPR
jgi:hypothetical protein